MTAEHMIAKTNKENSSEWLPLWMHLEDTAGIMERLVKEWLPDSVKDVLCRTIPREQLENVAGFLGRVHDIGKCTAIFQGGIAAWLPDIRDLLEVDGICLPNPQRFKGMTRVHHALAGYAILLKYQCPEGIASIVGAHHGKPQDRSATPKNQIEINWENFMGFVNDGTQWENLWEEIVAAALEKSGFTSMEELPEVSMSCQVLLSGLLIMADWIASNPHYFPLISVENSGDGEVYPERVERGWEAVHLPEIWNPFCFFMDGDGFRERFGFYANEVQSAMMDAVQSCAKPGIFVLEAQMGAGKTEAALAAAELLGTKKGSGGLYFGLPTQATANGIFRRLMSWAQKQAENELVCHGIRLAHGMAELNEDYQALFHGSASVDEDDTARGLIVHPWFNGRKQALLADFVIGTVDQLLMAALKQKHVMLRHLGLAGKIVIIDECHAYDAYMSQYLDMALTWLGEYEVPVILLSATLPEKRREELVNAYLKGRKVPQDDLWRVNRGYPLLTWTDGNEIKQRVIPIRQQEREVTFHKIHDEEILNVLREKLDAGGCAGIIVNTVSRAQKFAEMLKVAMQDYRIFVYHAHFISADRAECEKQLLKILGKDSNAEQRDKVIVVGTQVLEQSLDIDFDLMITDLCPMDLLLQRIGRLHRHKWRERTEKIAEANCYVLGALEDEWERGSETIYGEWLLLRTRDLLPGSVTLPGDIPELVQETYKDAEAACLQEERYLQAWSDYISKRNIRKRKADAYRVAEPRHSRRMKTMDGWLDTTISIGEKDAEAAVRDGDASLEVLVMVRNTAGMIHFVPWAYDGAEVPADHMPAESESRKIAGQRMRLPWVFGKRITEAIEELEGPGKRMPEEWQQSGWLRGELILFFDEDLTTKLCGYQLSYSRTTGLQYRKDGNEGNGI